MPERGGFQMLGEFLYDFSLMSANAYIYIISKYLYLIIRSFQCLFAQLA